MSMHLVECVKTLPVQPSTKLALIAFADSADPYTHLAFPGIESVQQWASVGRSRAAELVAELVDLGLLKKHRSGHRGRRAEYVVFPRGCCPAHPRPPAEEESDTPHPSSVNGSARPDANRPSGKGSAGPDSSGVNGSTTPDPNSADHVGSAGPDPVTGKGSGKGPADRTPSLTRTTNPPIPPQAGGTICIKHDTTQPNCRGCGTTNRQIAEQRRREAAEQRRRDTQAQLEAQRQAAATGRTPADATPSAYREARRSITKGGVR